MLSKNDFAADLAFGSRLAEEVRVLRGNDEIYIGKWRAGFHQRITSHALLTGETMTVLRVRDDRMLFEVRPDSIWEDYSE